MTTTLLIALAVLAALACPAHAAWRIHRGRSAGCMRPHASPEQTERRQRALAERVEEMARHSR